ncbi:unnamed protein product [Hydatigera taeniaeformis]|uniref:RWD domain-containing protein n=1 Tax=Hydatigena taeniaeformis TaxID=6205 RepID=A0A0R3WKG1_HYDTA|nr:unnamed protein product [Hydatigera taeniaeformis]
MPVALIISYNYPSSASLPTSAYGVYILPPIPTEGLTSADAGSLMEKTHAAMSEVFDLTVSANKEDLWMDLRNRKKLQGEEGEEQKQYLQ